MGKFLLSLMLIICISANSFADTYNWTCSSTQASKKDEVFTLDLNGIDWTITHNVQKGNRYSVRDGNTPISLVFGSNNAPISTLSFVTDYFKGMIINKVSIKAKRHSKANTTVATKINGTEIGIAKEINATFQEISFENLSEEVTVENGFEILFTNTSKETKSNGGVYISSIEVEYVNASAGPATPVYEINPENPEVIIGEIIDFPEISPSNLTYSFQTDDNEVIELNTIDKTIKGLKIGEATINFTTAPIEGQYLAGSGSFKVSVLGKNPQISFENPSIYGKVNTGVVWQQVTITDPQDNPGTVTYTSSDPETVTVDATTGVIKPADVKKAGVVTITGTIAANGDYAEGTASYQIVVVDPNEKIEPGTTVFDFTTNNPYGMTTQNGGGSFEPKIKSIAGENETVTLTFGGKYRSYNTSNAPYHLRLQKGATLKIAVPEGYKITKVGITGSDILGTYDPASGNVSESDNEDPDGGTFSYVWIPQNETDKVSEILYTSPSGSSAEPTQIKKINVMWDAINSDQKSAQLTFTPNVNGIYVNEIAEINVANNPNNRIITYSIPALTEDDYDIEEKDGKLHILVSKPGSYTLEARSVAGDGFRDGFAIMRLNVYRHLMVSADNVPLEKDEVNTGSKTFITINVPENAYLYYKIENSSAPAPTADEISDNENQLPGYELYEDGIEIPAKTSGTLNFYIANYGYKSPIRKIALSFETGVTDIDANTEDGVVRLFDLNGRQINGEPEKGVYIRIQNGKASKVLVK